MESRTPQAEPLWWVDQGDVARELLSCSDRYLSKLRRDFGSEERSFGSELNKLHLGSSTEISSKAVLQDLLSRVTLFINFPM